MQNSKEMQGEKVDKEPGNSTIICDSVETVLGNREENQKQNFCRWIDDKWEIAVNGSDMII